MQLRPIAAIAILLVVVTSISVAGCTVTNTTNQSVTQTQSSSTSNAVTDSYTSNGYEIVRPFTTTTNQYGNTVYSGVVNDNNASHLAPYQHNVTIELMKNKSETKQRVSQLAAFYRTQGYAFPANMTGTYVESDSTGAHQILMGGCDPNTICLSGLSTPFSQFTVVVDVQTRQG